MTEEEIRLGMLGVAKQVLRLFNGDAIEAECFLEQIVAEFQGFTDFNGVKKEAEEIENGTT